ncbi:hypothetical protein [Saccharopolyspora sp. 6M]|uniref:hypothetical protein n=1 Tax=Saccharopolyspora sp. 6M TaxID=2877237 RepID=UPI001CD4B273|nr:hypothetical protein [Saccharopolyspora sp. 6M]MCA1226069.1 hypothetical protein [Saccharopolyspora sp. 6M]
MQTWAKRGVRAALVTGGVLAVGTTMAAAEGTGPSGDGDHGSLGTRYDRSPADPERGGSVPPAFDADDARPQLAHSFAAHRNADTGRYRALVLTGKIDPVRDLLPAVEHDMTQEIPVLRDLDPARPDMQLAGWVGDPATARPAPGDGRHSLRRGAEVRTPAEGFHRSLSWAGPIGDIVRGGHGHPAEAKVPEVTGELIIPLVDPATVDPEDGIVALWGGALGGDGAERAAPAALGAGLLDSADVDLTSGELPGPDVRLHEVPPSLLVVALAEAPHVPAARSEQVALQVPGEHQDHPQVPPALSGPLVLARDGEPVQVPMPLGGELTAFGGGQLTGPTAGRLTEALGELGPRADDRPTVSFLAAVPRFSATPEDVPVRVDVLDELDATTPERDRILASPLPPEPRAAEPVGIELPALGAPPSINAAQGHTIPIPGLAAQPRGLDDTVEFQRI